MTLRQVEIFLAVARAKSFTRRRRDVCTEPADADRSTCTSSSVSSGCGCSTGSAARWRSTEARPAARGARSPGSSRRSRAPARRLLSSTGLERGSLLIGASTTPGIYVLPGIVAAFRRRLSGHRRLAADRELAVIEERIRADTVDLGVVGGHVLGTRASSVWRPGSLDELLLIVPPRHPWAERRQIAPRAAGRRPAPDARGGIRDPPCSPSGRYSRPASNSPPPWSSTTSRRSSRR